MTPNIFKTFADKNENFLYQNNNILSCKFIILDPRVFYLKNVWKKLINEKENEEENENENLR